MARRYSSSKTEWPTKNLFGPYRKSWQRKLLKESQGIEYMGGPSRSGAIAAAKLATSKKPFKPRPLRTKRLSVESTGFGGKLRITRTKKSNYRKTRGRYAPHWKPPPPEDGYQAL